MECREYVDKIIKEKTTFIDAKSFMEGAKPLKIMWLILLLAVAVGLIINTGVGILCGLVAIVMPMFITTFLNVKQNAQKYSYDGSVELDLDELCKFLKDSLNDFPFTEWQRGNLSTFGVVSENIEIIEVCFKNKTYHRILFDKTRKGEYQIQVSHASTKERMKRMSHANVLLYKSNYVVAPILNAAVEYYFSTEKQGQNLTNREEN